jgi:uncharacterized membrane protein YphA (DoxX/SURF4 family)
MFEKKVLNVYSVIIGIFFLISGFGKVIDTNGFSNLISQYGLGFFSILSPGLVILEISLGLFLVFLVYPKQISFVSFFLLIIFTGTFAYAHFKNGINDCGCFGSIEHSDLPPYLTFIRNIIFLAISFTIWIKYPKEKMEIANWKKYIIAIILGVSIFVAGLTYNSSSGTKNKAQKHKFQDKLIQNTELSKYLKTSIDSTYLIFCFSYTCPHCLNSIENLRQYKKSNTVDSVITLAIGKEPDRKYFFDNFKPDFYLKDLPQESMEKLTDGFPTAFYITHDSVKIVISGVLPSPITFKKSYKIQSK